jgi:hypothetical protein
MKKIYLLLSAVVLTSAIFAQRAIVAETVPFSVEKSNAPHNKAATDTLYSHMAGLTPALYTNGPGGYVFGHDSYGDLAYYQKFDAAAGTAAGSILNLLFYFAHVEGSPNSIVTATIRDDNAGVPGNVIGQVNMPYSSLDTSAAGFMNNGIVGWNSVGTFATPVTIPASGVFYAGFDVTYAAGDTVACVSNNAATPYTQASTHTWEQWSDMSWNDINTSWGADLTFAVYPVLDLAVGIEELNTVKFNVYPNPSTGEFNINLTSENSGNVNLSVKNVVGQTVLNRTVAVSGQTKETISLTDYSAGIYFLTIDNKTVKLIVE